MTTKYFILDDRQKPKEVNKAEHEAWINEHSQKYNMNWNKDDETKSFNLSFIGTQKTEGDLILFKVRSIFRDINGDLVTDFHDEFDDYEEAKEHYEFNLLQSGG